MREERRMFHQVLLSHWAADREEKLQQIWDWGIGYGGENGEWRAEACLYLSLAYLHLWKSWLEGFQIVTARVGE